MAKLPTAEEFAVSTMQCTDLQEIERTLIEFAKLHVEAALEAAGQKAIEIQRSDNRKYVSKKAIKSSYPLENIE